MGVQNYHTNSSLLTDNPKTILKPKEQPYLFRGIRLIHKTILLSTPIPKEIYFWQMISNTSIKIFRR